MNAELQIVDWARRSVGNERPHFLPGQKRRNVRVFLPETDEKRLPVYLIEDGAVRHTTPVIVFESVRYEAFGSLGLLQQ